MKRRNLFIRNGCFLLFVLMFLMLPQGLWAQQIQVQGRVTDHSTKEGVPGASILVKNTINGTITDLDGYYTINVDAGTVLVFSSIGYKDQEVTVSTNTSTINIELVDDNELLNEVVVVAYGTKSKATITGAMSSINNKDLVKSPAASITNSLAGAVPGVSSIQSSGQPGKDAATIYVRGAGSLSDAASSPLILVDGIERDFNQLDPNEIESISVLKDASSTAVFGVRGANGVILVTTRRGSSSKPSISVSSSVALQQPVAMVEQVGSYEYAKFYNMKADMDGSKDKFSAKALEAYRTGSDPIFRPSVNWSDYMFKNLSIQSKNNVNISGGTDNIKYFVSLGYLYQDGILKQFDSMPYDNNYKYNRYNYRANLDINLTKTTTMKIGVGGYIGINRSPNTTHGYTWGDPTWTMVQVWSTPFSGPGLVNGIRTQVPKASLPSGVEVRDGFGPFYGAGYSIENTTQLNMDVDITQKLDFITEGLSVSLKGAYDNLFLLKKSRNGGGMEYQVAWHKSFLQNNTIPETAVQYNNEIIFVPTGADSPLSYSESHNRDRNWYLEARINYDRTFKQDHKVGALLLYNQSRDHYPKNQSGALANYWYMPRGYVGFVGRVTYTYKNKYMVDANVGYNGSENFAPGKGRYGLFPSISAGWVITDEDFMKSQNIFDYLKLRASFGIVGSDVGTQTRFMYKPGSWSSGGSYSFGVDNANPLEGYIFGTPGNSGVTWETAQKQNYGLDMRFFQERLSATVDYFFEHRTGILIAPNSFPSIIATTLPNMNLGVVNNQGCEIALDWKDRVGQSFNYYVNANMSFARNKIIYMDEVKNQFDYQNMTGGTTGRNGNLYKFIRLYQESDFTKDSNGNYILNPSLPQPYVAVQPGDAMFEDMNKDGVIDANDQGIFGYSNRPEYTFGLNFGFEWKGLSLSMQWTGATNVDKLLQTDYIIPFTNAGGRGLLEHLYEGCWTPENQMNAIYPRPAESMESWNFGSGNNPSSTLWLMDSSYLRLKSLNLGYSFTGQPWLKKLGVSALTLTFSGYNLLTFSPLKLADPESITANSGGYPLSRLYSFGLNINF